MLTSLRGGVTSHGGEKIPMKSSQIMRQKISAFTKGKRQTILVGREKSVGPIEITFDFKKIYNLWQDYPQNMSREEVEILNEG